MESITFWKTGESKKTSKTSQKNHKSGLKTPQKTPFPTSKHLKNTIFRLKNTISRPKTAQKRHFSPQKHPKTHLGPVLVPRKRAWPRPEHRPGVRGTGAREAPRGLPDVPVIYNILGGK
jgi:hypothetical protein